MSLQSSRICLIDFASTSSGADSRTMPSKMSSQGRSGLSMTMSRRRSMRLAPSLMFPARVEPVLLQLRHAASTVRPSRQMLLMGSGWNVKSGACFDDASGAGEMDRAMR